MSLNKPLKLYKNNLRIAEIDRKRLTILYNWLKTGKNEKIELTEDKVIAVDSPSEESEKNYLAKVTGLTL